MIKEDNGRGVTMPAHGGDEHYCPNAVRIAILENRVGTIDEVLCEIKDDVKYLRSHMAVKKDVEQDMSELKKMAFQNLTQGGTIAVILAILSHLGVM